MFVNKKKTLATLLYSSNTIAMSWPLASWSLLQLCVAVICYEHATFKPSLHWKTGSWMCALNTPSAVISATDLLVGIPAIVLPEVQCGFICSGFPNCLSYNYIEGPVAQCQLYNYTVNNCVISSRHCKHYEVNIDQLVLVPTALVKLTQCDKDVKIMNLHEVGMITVALQKSSDIIILLKIII